MTRAYRFLSRIGALRTVSQAAYLGSRMEYSIASEIDRLFVTSPRGSTRGWRPGRRSS
jgi:hypothetical protein